jgi:hypothetical protein
LAAGEVYFEERVVVVKELRPPLTALLVARKLFRLLHSSRNEELLQIKIPRRMDSLLHHVEARDAAGLMTWKK